MSVITDKNRPVTNVVSNRFNENVGRDILDPLLRTAKASTHLIVSNGFEFRIGSQKLSIPKFLFLGERGGTAPLEVGIFAGLAPDQQSTSQAVSNLLIDLEWIPDVATNYVLFNYPVANPRAYSKVRETAPELNELFWQHSAEPEVGYLEKELTRHAFNIIITFQLDNSGRGFYATTTSQVIARDVIEPALRVASLALPLDSEPLQVLEVSRSGRVSGQPKGRLSAPKSAHPKPFEVSLYAPESASPEAQIAGFVLATKAILREYRKFIGHAQDL